MDNFCQKQRIRQKDTVSGNFLACPYFEQLSILKTNAHTLRIVYNISNCPCHGHKTRFLVANREKMRELLISNVLTPQKLPLRVIVFENNFSWTT